MPRKKVQKDVKSTNPEPRIDSNEAVGTEVPVVEMESIGLPKAGHFEKAQVVRDASERFGLGVTLELVKPKLGEMTKGSPYFDNGRLIGYLVIK